jgi:hypothetical protein
MKKTKEERAKVKNLKIKKPGPPLRPHLHDLPGFLGVP